MDDINETFPVHLLQLRITNVTKYGSHDITQCYHKLTFEMVVI